MIQLYSIISNLEFTQALTYHVHSGHVALVSFKAHLILVIDKLIFSSHCQKSELEANYSNKVITDYSKQDLNHFFLKTGHLFEHLHNIKYLIQ